MALEDLMKPVNKPEIKDIKPVPINLTDPEVIQKPEKGPGGIQGLFEVELNRQTKRIFDKGRRPHKGNLYVLKCSDIKGDRLFFTVVRK